MMLPLNLQVNSTPPMRDCRLSRGHQMAAQVEVAIEMAGGLATVSARFALDVMDTVWPGRAATARV